MSNPETFQQRRFQRRLRRFLPMLLGVAGVALVGAAVWAIWFSPLLSAQQIVVTGARTMNPEYVVDTSGLKLGTPLARLDLGGASHRVARLPAVAHVTISRDWPHTVTIALTERVPIASVHQGSTWAEMDKAGVLFRKTPGRVRSLPAVRLSANAPHDVLPQVATVVVSLPPDLMSQLRRIKAHTVDTITLVLQHHRKVRWGSAQQSMLKARVLAVLLSKKVHLYDVSVPQQPTTRR